MEDLVKKLVEVTEVEGEGLVALMGERVTLYCMSYIYTGKLVGVNDSFVKLEDPEIVYQTGSFSDKKWAETEKFPHEWYVQTSAVESFGLLK